MKDATITAVALAVVALIVVVPLGIVFNLGHMAGWLDAAQELGGGRCR